MKSGEERKKKTTLGGCYNFQEKELGDRVILNNGEI